MASETSTNVDVANNKQGQEGRIGPDAPQRGNLRTGDESRVSADGTSVPVSTTRDGKSSQQSTSGNSRKAKSTPRKSEWRKKKTSDQKRGSGKAYYRQASKNAIVGRQLVAEQSQLAGEKDARRESSNIQYESSQLDKSSGDRKGKEKVEEDISEAEELGETGSSGTQDNDSGGDQFGEPVIRLHNALLPGQGPDPQFLSFVRDSNISLEDVSKGGFHIDKILKAHVKRRAQARKADYDPAEHLKACIEDGLTPKFEFPAGRMASTKIPYLSVLLFLVQTDDFRLMLAAFLLAFFIGTMLFYVFPLGKPEKRKYVWLPFMKPPKIWHTCRFIKFEGSRTDKDLRAKRISLGKMEYANPVLAEFEYTWSTSWWFEPLHSTTMIASLEVMSQISTSENIQVFNMSDEDVMKRLVKASNSLHAVNVSRYDSLRGRAVFQWTVNVAYAYYKQVKYDMKKSRFPFPKALV